MLAAVIICFFQNGDTALHISAAMGRRKLTKILLESGCDKDAKNKQGETSMDISRRKNLVDIINILQNPPPLLSQEDRQDQVLCPSSSSPNIVARCHIVDDASTAQTKVQMQIVEQLEQQLYKVGIQTEGLITFMMNWQRITDCTSI